MTLPFQFYDFLTAGHILCLHFILLTMISYILLVPYDVAIPFVAFGLFVESIANDSSFPITYAPFYNLTYQVTKKKNFIELKYIYFILFIASGYSSLVDQA